MTAIDELWGRPTTTESPPTAPGRAPEQSPAEPKARPEWAIEPEKRGPNPIAQWISEMRGDIAARKARADGQWWAMRWMGEQPTSVADYVHFLAHERYQRRDGRKGWGLTTEAALIDGGHAFLFRAYGFLVGVPLTLVAYALGWMIQRPGRGLLLIAAAAFVLINLSTWLGGPQ